MTQATSTNIQNSSMSLSYLSKSISLAASTFGLVTIGNLLFVNSASSFNVTFTNGGFESPIAGSQNGWNTTGDVTTTGTIDGINPTNASNQAIITTGYIQDDYPQPVGNRNDDSNLIFNQTSQGAETNTNPVNSDTNVMVLCKMMLPMRMIIVILVPQMMKIV